MILKFTGRHGDQNIYVSSDSIEAILDTDDGIGSIIALTSGGGISVTETTDAIAKAWQEKRSFT